MELQGKIKLIDETKEYGTNGFRKREMVLITEEQYPQHILIEFIQDRTELLNKFQVGQHVKVGINIRGREWQSPEGDIRHFNSINGWRIESLTPGAPGPDIPPVPGPDTFESTSDFDDEEHDDLPF